MKKEFLSGLATVWPDGDDSEVQKVYFQPPKNKQYGAKWLVLWKDSTEVGLSMAEQAKNESLTLSDYRIRDYLIGTIGIGNLVFVNQREVSRELNLHKATVCASIKKLCNLGILLKGPKAGNANSYQINPAFCFFGGLQQGITQRKQAIQNQKSAKIIDFSSNKK